MTAATEYNVIHDLGKKYVITQEEPTKVTLRYKGSMRAICAAEDTEELYEMIQAMNEDAHERRMGYSHDDDYSDFADPGSGSSLRAATMYDCWECDGTIEPIDGYCRHCGSKLNPRKYPCPTCERPNMLSEKDVKLHYQCDRCTEAQERGVDY